MKPRHFLAIIIIPLGLIMAAIPQNTTHPYKLTPAELLEHVNSGMQYFTPDETADMIINKDPSLLLIDVRGEDEYEKFHLSRLQQPTRAEIDFIEAESELKHIESKIRPMEAKDE